MIGRFAQTIKIERKSFSYKLSTKALDLSNPNHPLLIAFLKGLS